MRRLILTVTLLLLPLSTTFTRGTSDENVACMMLMARFESIRRWCIQRRVPGHIVNTVRACIQRNEFSKDLSGTWPEYEDVIVGFSSSDLLGALRSSAWTECKVEVFQDAMAHFGTITLDEEDISQHGHRLWYAVKSYNQCWHKNSKKYYGKLSPEYNYEIQSYHEHFQLKYEWRSYGETTLLYRYSYIWGFNDTVYRKRKCVTGRQPYVPTLYPVGREVSSCYGCELWSEIKPVQQPVYLGGCWEVDQWPSIVPGHWITIGNRTRLCRVNGYVCYWDDFNPVENVTKAPGTSPSPSSEMQNFPEDIETSASVKDALKTLDPRKFRRVSGRTRSSVPTPRKLVSCLETILVESSILSQKQISRSLEGFEMRAASIRLHGRTKLLSIAGKRATLLVAEKVQGLVVSADGAVVASLESLQNESSAASLTSDMDVSAAVLVAAGAPAARLAVTFFQRTGVGEVFQQHGYTLNSDVISVQVIRTSIDYESYVDIVLRPTHSGIRRQCGLWDLERSVWNFSLCSLELQDEVNDVCRCRHLSHFAQLVTDADLQWVSHAGALEALSLAGVCASLLGVAGLGAAAALDPEWRRKPGSRVLLQLAGAVVARDALFAVVTAVGRLWWQPRASPGCVVLGVALHYSLLAAAAWTTAAAVLQLLRLGTVAGAQARVPHVVLVCSTCSWLLPLVPVAALMVVLGLRAGYPLREDSASDFLCYPQGAAFHISVLLPATVCILINAAIFLYLLFTVLFPLCRGGSGVVVTRHGPSQLRHRALTVVMLFFLLGLPWLLGPPAREPAVAYIFSIVATPQGLVLFIFFVLCNDKLRRRLSSTLLSTLPTSSSPLRPTVRKQKTQTPGGVDMSPHTSSSGVPASADGSVRIRRRQLEFPLQKRPPVLLTRYTVLGEDGQVQYTFDLSSWSPDDGNPFDAAYMPTSQDRRSVTKYVFPQTQMDQEGENSN